VAARTVRSRADHGSNAPTPARLIRSGSHAGQAPTERATRAIRRVLSDAPHKNAQSFARRPQRKTRIPADSPQSPAGTAIAISRGVTVRTRRGGRARTKVLGSGGWMFPLHLGRSVRLIRLVSLGGLCVAQECAAQEVDTPGAGGGSGSVAAPRPRDAREGGQDATAHCRGNLA
jgi:hypothetical protein